MSPNVKRCHHPYRHLGRDFVQIVWRKPYPDFHGDPYANDANRE